MQLRYDFALIENPQDFRLRGGIYRFALTTHSRSMAADVHRKVIDWCSENLSFEAWTAYRMLDQYRLGNRWAERQILIYEFKNVADATFFKMEWYDGI